MKIIPFLIAVGLITGSFGCFDSSAKKSSANDVNHGFAVIELFTSEGCSSCPPADKAVAKLLKEHSSNVYVLGYHVDYWDKYDGKIFSAMQHILKCKENMQRLSRYLQCTHHRLL